MPGLAGDNPVIANGLLVDERASGLLCFEAHVFIAGHALALEEPGGSEYLGAMADGENPFVLRVESPNYIEQPPIVVEILGGGRPESGCHRSRPP